MPNAPDARPKPLRLTSPRPHAPALARPHAPTRLRPPSSAANRRSVTRRRQRPRLAETLSLRPTRQRATLCVKSAVRRSWLHPSRRSLSSTPQTSTPRIRTPSASRTTRLPDRLICSSEDGLVWAVARGAPCPVPGADSCGSLRFRAAAGPSSPSTAGLAPAPHRARGRS